MKKILKLGVILLLALLVLGGGLAGATKFGLIPDVLGLFSAETPPPSPVEPKELTALERLGQPPFLVTLNPMEIPVIMNGRIVRRASFHFRVQIAPEDSGEFEYLQDKLQAEMLEVLMGLLPRQLETRNKIDLMAVRQRMRKVADSVMGVGKVKDVLIQGYFER